MQFQLGGDGRLLWRILDALVARRLLDMGGLADAVFLDLVDVPEAHGLSVLLLLVDGLVHGDLMGRLVHILIG